MAANPAQTHQQIADTRNRIATLLDELEAAVKNLLDWRHTIRQRPLTASLLAFGAGFILVGGHKHLAQRLYDLIRPQAKQRRLENVYLRKLRETLDATLGGLPPSIATQARDLRVLIEHTDAKEKPAGTIVINPQRTPLEHLAVKAGEIALSLVFSALVQRFLDQLSPKRPS